MSDSRPNPDVLLAQVTAEAAREKRGSLKIFFGYAAGVGKTYSMLEAAHQAVKAGHIVVVGYVEAHARPETQSLVEGLEVLPVKFVDYQGVKIREFDIDAALARRPEIILVDELAHTNAKGCRHGKRWQDINELLEAGIDVWTTLNVQHIESLNDVISQITGIVVRETVPDKVFDSADDLELVDITPDELLTRLQEGKVYIPEQAKRAIQSFFQKAHLTALRELSLRQAVHRIHTDVESARRQRAAIKPWATAERLLVCVGPSPTTARVIRTAKRLAVMLDAPWLAVSVDTTGASQRSSSQQKITQHFRLAEQLGAETVTLVGENITATILEYARTRNVTKILIGKTKQPRWKRFLRRSIVDDILEHAAEIDVYVIHGAEEPKAPEMTGAPSRKFEWKPYAGSVLAIAATCFLAHLFRFFQIADAEANTVMLFLATVAWSAFKFGRGPAILASVLAVLAFDFFFVPPNLTFAVSDVQYLVTFLAMLVVGLLISTLAARLRAQIQNTRLRERRTSALYELGKQLSSMYGHMFLASAAGKRIAEIFGGEVVIYRERTMANAELTFGADSDIARHPVSLPTAQWVIEHNQIAGAGTNTLPNAPATFFPIVGSQKTHGAIGLKVSNFDQLLDPEQRRMLEACSSQLALALERDEMAITASEARIEAEAEQVRSSLFSSVSHDLKTPLAAIAGSCSSLLESSTLDQETRRQLLETVASEAARLNRLLDNILQMSKLDAGAATPQMQWHVLDEIVGSAVQRTRREFQENSVSVQIQPDLPLIFADGLLLEQLFVNLLENAAHYTPSHSKITVSATLDGASLRVSVSDNGPGLPPGSEERIFEKFYRASGLVDAGRGSGLGLAICRAIAKAHGGNITAANRPGGGAEFVLRLPLHANVPQVKIQ